MIFHCPQKKINQKNIPQLLINDIPIKHTQNFDFLGLTISETMQWNAHINKVANKISKTIGVMYRIKRFVDQSILKLIYNALILPHLSYSLLCWGFSICRLKKLQKKAIRVICTGKYNAHTEPLFKNLKLLTVADLFKINALKFVFKYQNNILPPYFDGMLDPVEVNHDYNTRHQNLRTNQPKRSSTKQCLRYFIPNLLRETPSYIVEKFHSHSPHGFSVYVKNKLIDEYKTQCLIENCYICRSGADV